MSYDDDGYFIEAEEKPDFWYCAQCEYVTDNENYGPSLCPECGEELCEGWNKVECENEIITKKEYINDMESHRNKNKTIQNSVLERRFVHESFAKNGIQTPIEKYHLIFDHKRREAPRLDPDNICTKWITDSIVAAGILQDDSFKNMPQGFIVNAPEIVQSVENEEVIITIEIL